MDILDSSKAPTLRYYKFQISPSKIGLPVVKFNAQCIVVIIDVNRDNHDNSSMLNMDRRTNARNS